MMTKEHVIIALLIGIIFGQFGSAAYPRSSMYKEGTYDARTDSGVAIKDDEPAAPVEGVKRTVRYVSPEVSAWTYSDVQRVVRSLQEIEKNTRR